MGTDDEIGELFSKVIRDLDPAVGGIVGNAERLGRRMRSRRRKLLAAGNTLAAVAVVGAVIGIQQVGSPAGPGAAGAVGAAGSSESASPSGGVNGGVSGGVSASASASANAGTSLSARAGGKSSPPARHGGKPAPGASATESGGMTRHQMLHTLRSLLPAGSVLSDVRTGPGPGSLEVDYNDGHGAVDLMLDVTGPGGVSPVALKCPTPLWTDEGTRPAGALPISCVRRTLADGSVERDAVMYADALGFYGYDIYDQRPDGVTVFTQVGNGTLHSLPHVDRATPPGSMAEWESLVESPAWHL